MQETRKLFLKYRIPKGNKMETISIKALALKALEGNQQGNQKETKSFPMRKPDGKPPKSFPVELPSARNQGASKTKPVKALGYGCAGCSNRIYQAIEAWQTSELPPSSPWEQEHTPVTHWKCQGCGAVFSIIGGTRGPVFIQ